MKKYLTGGALVLAVCLAFVFAGCDMLSKAEEVEYTGKATVQISIMDVYGDYVGEVEWKTCPLDKSGKADVSGNIVIEDIDFGKFNIELRKSGYLTVVKEIDITIADDPDAQRQLRENKTASATMYKGDAVLNVVTKVTGGASATGNVSFDITNWQVAGVVDFPDITRTYTSNASGNVTITGLPGTLTATKLKLTTKTFTSNNGSVYRPLETTLTTGVFKSATVTENIEVGAAL